MALFVEHDLVDYINAASTVVIAAFTVLMFFVVKYQLRASKDIERAWIVVSKLEKPPTLLMLVEHKSTKGEIVSFTTAARLHITFKNEGHGIVWVKRLQARFVLVDSIDHLPKKVELHDEDDQHWSPGPFVESAEVDLELKADGNLTGREPVVYGKIMYRDKFQEERFSTFGYALHTAGHGVKRLESHPEYNRNT